MKQTFDFSIWVCDCLRGAPMGRYDNIHPATEETLRARRMPLDSGGYDAGGAYWGLGKPMYVVAGSEGSRGYERAKTRKELRAILAKRYPEAKLAGFPSIWCSKKELSLSDPPTMEPLPGDHWLAERYPEAKLAGFPKI